MDSIGKINLLLSERGMTGAELSRLIGVSNAVYSQWNKRRSKPSNRSLKKIAEVLNIEVRDILSDEALAGKTVSNPDKLADIDVQAAFFEGYGEDLSPEEKEGYWKDAQEYIMFKVAQSQKDKGKRGNG